MESEYYFFFLLWNHSSEKMVYEKDSWKFKIIEIVWLFISDEIDKKIITI